MRISVIREKGIELNIECEHFEDPKYKAKSDFQKSLVSLASLCFNGEKKNNNALIKNKNACVMREDENKGREDAFSKKDVSVLEGEEQGLKEERNENHLPNKEQTNKKKYKSEKSVKFLFREATKARNEHVHSMNNSKGKVTELEYEKEREEEEDFSTPIERFVQTMMQKQQLMKEEDRLRITT